MSTLLLEASMSLPTTSRWNGWYQQRSNTSLLDPAIGADNYDDDGSQKLHELEQQLNINCLHRGSNMLNARTKYLVAVDGTPASRRALDYVIQNMKPEDHVLVAHIWAPAIPLEHGAMMWEDLDDPTIQLKSDYKKWLVGKEILREYQLILANRADIPPASYTCVFLPSHDHRERICKLAREFKVNILVLGKHRPTDKRYRQKNWHRKTFRSYCRSNSKTMVKIVE